MNFLRILQAIPLIAPAVRAIVDVFRPAPKAAPTEEGDSYAARQGTAAGAAANEAGKKVSSK